MNNEIGLEAKHRPARTVGDKYEGLAFTFCKVASVALIAERFTLPLAAFLSATFYVLAYVKDKKDTRCWARVPLLIAGFWIFVGLVALIFIFRPDLPAAVLAKLRI